MGNQEDSISVTVQTADRPTFNFEYERGPDETDEEARERALELARHDAAVSLSDTAHEYDWVEAETYDDGNPAKIGTLVISEGSNIRDIEDIIDYGIESSLGLSAESNQDGTYDILKTVKGVAPIEGPSVEVMFTPQAWMNDQALEVDCEQRRRFTVPLEDALTESGALVKSDSSESDLLKNHERVPDWINNWGGPFYITIQEMHDLPEGKSPEDYSR